jgi:hypothetical protein
MPRIFFLAASAAAVLGFQPAMADDVKSVSTGGKGDLTMCSYRGCNLYHHIKLPPQITIGDTVRVHFGSNPKHYDFPVAWIVRDGDACKVFAQPGETEDVTKLEIAACQATAGVQ